MPLGDSPRTCSKPDTTFIIRETEACVLSQGGVRDPLGERERERETDPVVDNHAHK